MDGKQTGGGGSLGTQGEINPPREPLGGGRGATISAPIAMGSAAVVSTPPTVNAQPSGSGASQISGSVDPISDSQKEDSVNTDPEKAVKKISPRTEDEDLLESILDGTQDPTDLPLALLKDITDNFSKERIIGHGGFGVVYKGVFRKRIVAVKKIDVNLQNIEDHDKQFFREIKILCRTMHRNIVRFLGFCSNKHEKWIPKDRSMIMANVRQRLFCFEYISNGSLDKKITDELRGLTWESRYEIIYGICEGLKYLHNKKVIHMDLKPANILLDLQGGNYIPKIADFGLSRPDEKSHTLDQCFGTPGYWAPENMFGKKTILACDIYSLGTIIMELVTGSKEGREKHNVLRRWRHKWNNPPTTLQYQQVNRCIDIAVRCREHQAEDRPSISEIMDILSAPGSTDDQEIGTYMEDDMLGIEPLNLHLNEEMTWPIKLSNNTETSFMFNIEGQVQQHTIRPEKGSVPPGCKEYPVQITVQPQEGETQVTQNEDKIIVRSNKEGSDEVFDVVELIFSPKAIISSSYAERELDRRKFNPPKCFSHSQATNMTYLQRASDRAIDLTRGAMGSLLHKLGELHKEFNLELSVKEVVGSLSNELLMMQPVLRKVSDVQQDHLDDLVMYWAKNVREMSYDLEDFVDGFLVQSEPNSDGSGFRDLTHEICLLLGKGKSQHMIGDLIKHHISKQVQDGTKKLKQYNVDHIVANAATKADIRYPHISGVCEDQDQLVGIKTPRDDLIRLFEEDGDVSEQLRIISIVGMGGLGKTELAKAVYDKLKARHDLNAFVSVGQNPDVRTILNNILSACGNYLNATNLNEQQLIDELNKLLKNKRYFIVVDDIWDLKAWTHIKYALPRNKNGSRVMITTRIHSVALNCCDGERKYFHEIKQLRDEDSRSMFLRRIFGPGENCSDAQKNISIDILKKCGGMPLAVNSIASFLAHRPWSWDYVWKSLGAITDECPEIGKKILDISCIHLPDDLKTCLLYVCKYPGDREIDKYHLLRQWVAEGFVGWNGRLDAVDIAENNFKRLIDMCMIEPVKIDYNNEVVSCRVHDIILDLIRSKSAEVNFLKVIDGSKDEAWKYGEIRRVSLHYIVEDDVRTLERIRGSLSHVRSVSLYRGSLLSFFLVFKYIRVLHLEDDEAFGGYLDLTGIDRLFLLRYLKVALNFERLKLPSKIGQLQQLETIDLRRCRLGNYPSDIDSLPSLSHLAFGETGIALPDGIDRLKSLCTLEGVCVYTSSVDNIKSLGELTNLRKLQLCSMNYLRKQPFTCSEMDLRMNALHSSISRLSTSLSVLAFGYGETGHTEHFQGWSSTLFPQGSHIRKLDLSSCNFQTCPEWIGQLNGLYSLSITVREVADGLAIVGSLPSLAFFHLLNFSNEREESVVISGSVAFPALKHLIFRCEKASLIIEKGALPQLEKLELNFRYHMTDQYLPVGIQHLPTLSLSDISLYVGRHPSALNFEGTDNRIKEHKRKWRARLKRAFEVHLPGAEIVVHFFEDYQRLRGCWSEAKIDKRFKW